MLALVIAAYFMYGHKGDTNVKVEQPITEQPAEPPAAPPAEPPAMAPAAPPAEPPAMAPAAPPAEPPAAEAPAEPPAAEAPAEEAPADEAPAEEAPAEEAPLKRRRRNRADRDDFGAVQAMGRPFAFRASPSRRRSAVHPTFRLNPVSLPPNLMLDCRGRSQRKLGGKWRLRTALLRAGGSRPPPWSVSAASPRRRTARAPPCRSRRRK